MLRKWRSNKQGILYIYIVIIIALFAVGVFSFLLANGVGVLQDAVNPQLEAENWVTTGHFDAFSLAATFVTNLWVFFVVFLVVGLLYWGYIESQRDVYR